MQPYRSFEAFPRFLGTVLPAMCLVMICRLESRFSVSILLTLWMGTHGFQTSGLTALFHDVAHTRASELFAIGNVFSKFAGILAGPMFSRNAALWGWKCVLCGLAIHYVMSGLVLISLMHRSKQASRLFATEDKAALKLEAWLQDAHLSPERFGIPPLLRSRPIQGERQLKARQSRQSLSRRPQAGMA